MVLCDGPVLTAADFPQVVQAMGGAPAAATPAAAAPAAIAPTTGLPQPQLPNAASGAAPTSAPDFAAPDFAAPHVAAPAPLPMEQPAAAVWGVPPAGDGVHRFGSAGTAPNGNGRDRHGPDGGIAALGSDGEIRSLEEVETDLIRLALQKYDGQMSEVARRLGIGRSTLYRKVRGLDDGASA